MKKIPIILGVALSIGCNNNSNEYYYLIEENEQLRLELECKNIQIHNLQHMIRFEEATLQAIKEVESNNKPVLGDAGRAYGILQIHKVCVDEVNRLYNVEYRHSDAWTRELSEHIFWLTMERAHYENANWDNMIQHWNGGPKIRNRQTKRYLKKVKKLRNEINKSI